MRLRRDEAFRFEFDSPIAALFTIERINDQVTHSHEGEGHILDLSPRGMKLLTPFDIPISDEQQVNISVRFKLIENEYTVQGNIIWQEVAGEDYHYGLHLTVDEYVQEALIDELKHLAASTVNGE
ncbi:hypothetical protein GCM10011391_14530 [Pullulanibacillus camelliae]|uniref:PilZ domain-containing protein n=1 Tax=Pullulanibacillus camelliae TaxID=1707096 RepID=A0A8J2YGP2_9BACL|nr:PilZ domain-containing protein [Pullulanibacillus camelliae]GGE36768.1 hypothetical protein GCM10011391_14530 [Pullulanibacillus camelliae]